MKTTSSEIVLHRWAYGLEVQSSSDGLTLRPLRKARTGWAKAFRQRDKLDELAPVRNVSNDFDGSEWAW